MTIIQFLEGFPALLIGQEVLVIADLHLGKIIVRDKIAMDRILRHEIRKVDVLINKYGVDTLIVNGDIKETLGMPSKIVSGYINELLSRALNKLNRIILILGNHDGKIAETVDNELLSKLEIKRIQTIYMEGKKIIISHGHIKLECSILEGADIILTAHIHPAFSLTESNSLKVKVWGIFDILLNCDKQKRVKWVVMPAFASYITGIPLNRASDDMLIRLSPFSEKKSKMFKRNYFLLDLTPLRDW